MVIMMNRFLMVALIVVSGAIANANNKNSSKEARAEFVRQSVSGANAYIDEAMKKLVASGYTSEHRIFRNLSVLKKHFESGNVQVVWSPNPGVDNYGGCGKISSLTGEKPVATVRTTDLSKIGICERAFESDAVSISLMAETLIHESIHTLQKWKMNMSKGEVLEFECQAFDFQRDIMAWVGVGTHFHDDLTKLAELCKMREKMATLSPDYNLKCSHSG